MTLPNFLIIGAAKAGTTSLHHYLRQHPDVYMSPVKEARYYASEWWSEEPDPIRTREAYERLFDGVTTERAVGEASPQYLNSPTAPDRIAADLPDVKLIVSLRNPADRAYSSYLGRLCGGQERRGVDAAMRPGTYYFLTSQYHPRLSRYFARFPRSRIKVIVFDDLAADARAVVRDLSEFLAIDAAFAADVATAHNGARTPRSIVANEILCRMVEVAHHVLPVTMRGTGLAAGVQRLLLRPPDPLPPSIRQRLLEQLRDDIARTGALIGRDLSHWLD
jgi:hypothetical protein